EAKAFSFWLLMLALPNENRDFFDSLHDTYFESIGLTSGQLRLVYEELSARYEKYRDAYNSFVESRGNSAIGETLITIVKNRNLDFLSRKDLVAKIMQGKIPPLNPL